GRRFGRYLERDDRAMERFLAEIAGGATERAALDRVNALGGTEFTVATLRRWMREDQDFARALRAARSQPPGEAQVIDLNAYAWKLAAEGKIPPLQLDRRTARVGARHRRHFGPEYGKPSSW